MKNLKSVAAIAISAVSLTISGAMIAEAGNRPTVPAFPSAARVCMDKNLAVMAEHLGDSITAGGEHTVNATKDREWVAYQLRAAADNVQFNSTGRASFDKCWK